MDGNFYRGEIYNMRLDGGWGSEEAAMRPALIISNDRGNENCPTVICAMLTTKFKYGAINVETTATGIRSWVMCNQLRSFDKTRALKYLGALNDEDMAAVEKALCVAMSLNGDYDESEIENLEAEISEKDAEIKEKDAEIEKLKARIAEKEAEISEKDAATVHNDMWKKLYEKALDTLVDVKMMGDLAKRMADTPAASAVKAPEVKVEPVIEAAPVKPEINTCTEADLKKIGCSPVVAHSIVARRPYKSVADLRMVPYLTTVTYHLIKDKVNCEPVVEEKEEPKEEPKKQPAAPKKSGKVNVNTAAWEEIAAIGVGPQTAKEIIRYRKKVGKINSLDELKNATVRWGNGNAKKYGPMLEV